jgi:uncharacterized protein YyaL (SSP411 family)
VPHVDWQPWHTTAFLDAQRRRRPVLLLLDTAWSPACAHAHAETFTRPDVTSAIADTAVAVRVDADRRPDIGDRYGLGHWPSLLFLTPEGAVLTGGTHLDHTLATRIRDVAAAFESGDGRWPASPRLPAPPCAGDEAALAAIAQAIAADADPRTGACLHDGAPSASATLFALAQAAMSGDADWAGIAAATIDALDSVPPNVGGSGVLALVPGVADWPAVARLEDQADWTRALALAVRLEPLPVWVAHLERLLHGLRSFRRDDGHWRPFTGAGRLVLVDASARACRALLAAAHSLDRPDMAADAIDALEVLAPAAYARASGVAHVLEDGLARGPILLDDATLMAHALLDADAWRGDTVYRDLAEELVRTTSVRLHDGSGALVDRVASLAGAGQVGRLAEPHHPLTGNAEMARLLRRLFPDDAAAAEQARGILRAVGADAAAAGVLGAPVGLAWHALQASGTVAAAW